MLSPHASTKPRPELTGNAGSTRWPAAFKTGISASMRCRLLKALGCLKKAFRTGAAAGVPAGVALLVLLAGFNSSARQVGEYEEKAVFLLNFAKFVEWPAKTFPDAKAPFVIGILGDDPFGDALVKIVKGQTARGRRIEVRHFKATEDYGGCQLLFLSRSVAAQSEEILQRLQGQPVLTVSEQENFVRQGGTIGFVVVGKSVRFDINARAAAAANLKVSSKLLAVARMVLKSS
jgi:hypothetical protein